VPWCQRCNRFLNPNTVLADGTCPTCGRQVDRPTPVGSRGVNERSSDAGDPSEDLTDGPGRAEAEEDDEDVKAPWHFWVMIAAAVLYLGWRFLEGIWWAIRQVL
jgi:hypothetical protein